jgi:hypothetical protein
VRTVIDDHSRVADAEIHDDGTAITAAGVLTRAVAWFATRGVTVRRVLSDNGSAYKSHLGRDTCAELSITVKKTRPLPVADEREDRTFHRTPGRQLDLRHALHLGESPPRRVAGIPGPTPPSASWHPLTRLNNLAGHHN